jgi:pteridine reductase
MTTNKKVMLITGAARRIGAQLAQFAHADDYNIVLHYRQSLKQTQALKEQLNNIRANSCILVQADFDSDTDFRALVNEVISNFGRLDVLINNASEFAPTKLSELSTDDYNVSFNSNVRGPLFLSKSCFPLLNKSKGSIINLVDIHADKPLKNYPVYSMAKAANKMMVKALAKEYAPNVRVNGVSPGCILWPNDNLIERQKKEIINRIILAKKGEVINLYQTIKLLIVNDYITGEIIKVDGGRSLNM